MGFVGDYGSSIFTLGRGCNGSQRIIVLFEFQGMLGRRVDQSSHWIAKSSMFCPSPNSSLLSFSFDRATGASSLAAESLRINHHSTSS